MGAALCLVSAAAFGAMAIFGKLAYDAGADAGDVLLVRFALAAAVLAVLATATGALRGLPRRGVAAALGMGAIGYATQAGLFFGALERMDASLLSLLLYTFPAMVAVAAAALGRERLSRRRVLALAMASAGTALVLLGAAAGALDPLGAAMALGAAVTYSTYILVGDRVLGGVPPLALAALVTAGAAATFAAGAIAMGDPVPALTADALGWIAAIALVSTVGAILAFFAGLARVGPTTASILSTLEPVVTVTLAALVFGEALGAVQLAGGALVLAAVVVLQAAAAQRVPRVQARTSRSALPVMRLGRRAPGAPS